MRTSSARARTFGRLWTLALLILDVSAVIVATILGYYIRFGGVIPPEIAAWTTPLLVVSLVIYIPLFAAFGLYRLAPRRVALDVLLNVLGALAIGFALLLGIDYLYPMPDVVRPVPIGVLAIQTLLLAVGVLAARFAARAFVYVRSARGGAGRRIVIVGAGEAGASLVREIRDRPDLGLWVLGFLDDDPKLHGRSVGGVKVIGGLDHLGETLGRLSIEEVIVAMPGASKRALRDAVNTAAAAGIGARIVPESARGRAPSLRDLRPAGAQDLVAQEPARVDRDRMASTVKGKSVAITGAGGSIGCELSRLVCALGARQVALIDVDESRLVELALDLDRLAPGVARAFVCNVREPERLDEVFAECRPEIVFHCAAYGQVGLMESAPAEAAATNVVGTRNVLAACEDAGVARLVHISATRAGAPRNVVDVTKLLAERLVLGAGTGAGGRMGTVVVRLGNVLRSRGGVVSIFEHQLRGGGPLTVTDPEASRRFVADDHAARLVLQAQALGDGATYVIESGEPIRILDLAQKMAALAGVPASIAMIGWRPGEDNASPLVQTAETTEPAGSDCIERVTRETGAAAPDAATAALLELARTGNARAIAGEISRLEEGARQGASLGTR